MRIARPALWIAVLALTLLGVYAALARTYDAVTADPMRTTPAPLDQIQFDRLARLRGLERDSELFREAERDFAAFARTYVAHRVPAMLHLLPGALFLGLAPLQFSRRIRGRHPAVHRWLGRGLLATLLVSLGAAFFLGIFHPFGGPKETAAIVTFGGFCLFAAARAWRAIRRRDVAVHRAWMLRMYAVAIGVTVIRVIGVVIAFFATARPRDQFGAELWIGWMLSLGFVELWIVHTRRQQPVPK
jgi:uncharacterized membrane protein